MSYKSLDFFLPESMKIWKSDIFTLSSKSDYISLSRIDQEDLLPDNVTIFYTTQRLLENFKNVHNTASYVSANNHSVYPLFILTSRIY